MEGPNNPRVTIAITRQLNQLRIKSPDGVKVMINDSDIFDIQAEFIGPVQTPYEGGIFCCKLQLPADFPKTPPKGYFLTKIFHPNVSEKGEICVNTLKKDWNPQSWSFYNIFEVIKCLLIVPFPESALNEEAGKLFMEDYDAYFKHARLMTEVHSKPKDKEKLSEPTTSKQLSKERNGSTHLPYSSSNSSISKGNPQNLPPFQSSFSQPQSSQYQISPQNIISGSTNASSQLNLSSNSPFRESGRQISFPYQSTQHQLQQTNSISSKNQNQENLQLQGFNSSGNGSFLAPDEPLSVLSKNNGYSFSNNPQASTNIPNAQQYQIGSPSSVIKPISQLQGIIQQQQIQQSSQQQQQQQMQPTKNKINMLLHLTFNTFTPSQSQPLTQNITILNSEGKVQTEKNKWLKRL